MSSLVNFPISRTLYMHISTDNEMRDAYMGKVESHNQQLITNLHYDSGFDLFVDTDHTLYTNKVNKIDFKVKCEMRCSVDGQEVPCGFYMYPRSSISKSKFRLANNVGIIDSGYRGHLIGMFDVVYSQEQATCLAGTRLIQVCSSTLEPFKIVVVNSDADLSSSQRNEGGFGSTGGASNV